MAESSGASHQFAVVRNDSPTVGDALNRGGLVDRIVHIVKTVTPPFTLGVYGGWGSGKSSIMAAVRERLETDGTFGPAAMVYAGPLPAPPRGVPVPVGDGMAATRDYRGTVWFSAWEHQADTDPAVAMLQEARRLLRPSWLNRWRMRRWFRVLRGAIGPALEGVGPRVATSVQALRLSAEKVNRDLFAVQEDQVRKKEAFQEIVNLLARRNPGADRIVFFVDDLDRCDDEVAARLLDDIKTYLDQATCVFVIGVNAAKLRCQHERRGASPLDQCERRDPRSAADEHEGKVEADAVSVPDLGEDRLAKIINYPFYVPPLEREEYGQFLVRLLLERFERPGGATAWSSVTQGVADVLKETLVARSASVRETVRLSNVFTVNYELTQRAFDDEGLASLHRPELVAILSVIQAFHPKVHEWLCTNGDWFDEHGRPAEQKVLPGPRRLQPVHRKLLYLFAGHELPSGAAGGCQELEGTLVLDQARRAQALNEARDAVARMMSRAPDDEVDQADGSLFDRTVRCLGLYLSLGSHTEQELERPEGSRWEKEHRARPDLSVEELRRWILAGTLAEPKEPGAELSAAEGTGRRPARRSGWRPTDLRVVRLCGRWWWVLEVKDQDVPGQGPKKCALLLSESIVDVRPYDGDIDEQGRSAFPDLGAWNQAEPGSMPGTRWSSSSLRRWLQLDFVRSLAGVRHLVVPVTNATYTRWAKDDDIWRSRVDPKRLKSLDVGPRGKEKVKDDEVVDTVFLLSAEEIWDMSGAPRMYYPDEGRGGEPGGSHRHSPYHHLEEVDADARQQDGVVGFWWFRSPGDNPLDALAVLPSSLAYPFSHSISLWAGSRAGVRPAFWLNLES